MIVMGAFVHSRFCEAVLGGVTRSLLNDGPVPLFMSHQLLPKGAAACARCLPKVRDSAARIFFI